MLGNAVQFGGRLLVEGLPEEVDPVLLPLLRHGRLPRAARGERAGQDAVRIGDDVVPFEPSFRLYLATTLPNPRFPAEVCVSTAMLNFVATRDGVHGQMLALVVKEERPEMETRREQLLAEDAEHQARLGQVRRRRSTARPCPH